MSQKQFIGLLIAGIFYFFVVSVELTANAPNTCIEDTRSTHDINSNGQGQIIDTVTCPDGRKYETIFKQYGSPSKLLQTNLKEISQTQSVKTDVTVELPKRNLKDTIDLKSTPMISDDLQVNNYNNKKDRGEDKRGFEPDAIKGGESSTTTAVLPEIWDDKK